MSKWNIPDRRKPLPEPKEVIICRVVPPRLARIEGIAEWLYSGGSFDMRKVKKDFVYILMQRYKELKDLGLEEE